MEPRTTGRHCTNCNKTVVDFSSWSDADLFRFFASSNGNVCGRFTKFQLDRVIRLPYQPHSRLYRLALAMGFSLLLNQLPEALLARTRPPYAAMRWDQRTGSLHGSVTNSTNAPVAGANITLWLNGTQVAAVCSDTLGAYNIEGLETGNYELVVAHKDHNNKLLTHVLISDKPETANIVFAGPQIARAAIVAKSDAGCISGQVVDSKREPLINASVTIKQDGKVIAGGITDYDGHYELGGLKPGTYEAIACYIGMETQTITCIQVPRGDSVIMDITLHYLKGRSALSECIVVMGRPSIIQPYQPAGRTVITRDQIKHFGH